MRERTPEQHVREFMDRYDPAVSRVAKAARTKLRRLLPGALELVYDNYNALAIGFSPTESASDVIASIALYPRWVSLFLMRGAVLPDPELVLRGSGSRVRHIVLESAAVLDTAPVRALVEVARATHPKALPRQTRRTIIKSVSKKQRPRRSGASRGRRTRR